MKLCLFCSRLEMGGGGLERLARDLVEGLLDLGVGVHVVARKIDRDLPVVSRLDGYSAVNVKFLPGKLRDKYASMMADRIVRKQRFDLVLSCYRSENADVWNCGETRPGNLASRDRRPTLFDRLAISMEAKQCRRAKTVIANSLLLRDELMRHYEIGPERIALIYPAVDTARFRPPEAGERAELRRRFGFADDRKVFVFPSGSHERKGLPFIRPFFESTDLPVELVVAGRGVRDGKNVRGLGYVRDIERLYQAADAAILASAYEPFGMVAVESVCCGTPAIMSDNMGCCEALREPALWKIRRNDPASLERAVAKIMTFDRSSLRDPGQFISYDVTRENMAREVLAVLEKAAVTPSVSQ